MAATAEPVPAAGTASPTEMAAKLKDLKAAATKEYSLKNYEKAADIYSEATELQAELNGEMSSANAELLYAYGRCLYHVAVSKSDVLGEKVASREEPKRKKRKIEASSSSDALKSGEEKIAEEVVEAVVEEKDSKINANDKSDGGASKPFFQITGDENWTDSEPEDDDADGDGEPEEEEDDFANAYEVLDLARVLLTKQIDTSVEKSDSEQALVAGQDKGKGKSHGDPLDSAELRAIKERLADTYDLQSEIWLEGERFDDAVSDSRAALQIKEQIFAQDNALIAEANFKLALALELAAVRKAEQNSEAKEAGAAGESAKEERQEVDEEMRKEAAAHIEKAIASCKARVDKEKTLLDTVSGEEQDKKEREIKDVEEMIQELKQKHTDLINPAVTSNSAADNPLGGILGSILGESIAEQKTRIAEATKGANDLSGLIRKKVAKPVANGTASGTEPASVKRKLDDDEHATDVNGKKARVEET